jgi:hypothetical protein
VRIAAQAEACGSGALRHLIVSSRRLLAVLVIVLLFATQPALGWQAASDGANVDKGPDSTANQSAPSSEAPGGAVAPLRPAARSARSLVEEGNRRFKAGQYDTALESYDEAKAQRPDSLEVEFDRGLSAFSLGRLDEARSAFERVTLSRDTDLAENAMYGLGACDHAEALARAEQNPKEAVTQLEQAMRRYHDVLSARPDHPLARDANYRAGLKWRQIKELMERQQQQQQQQQQGNENQEQSEDQQDQQQQDQQDQSEQNEKQDGEPQQSDDQQDQQGQQEDQQQSNDQQAQESQQSDQQQDQQQQSEEKSEEEETAEQAEAKEDLSRDQAARELRRLMDQMRERKQERRQPIREIPAPPLEKDW